jgi:phosphoserine phosphatase RsbU/P
VESSYGRILSVDNEPAFRQEVNSYLEDSGFTTFEATTNKEGLMLFREKKPDLVLSSLQMMDENGLELLDAIRNESPETPVIVISKTEGVDNLLEALHLGAWDYIIKPIKNMAVLEHAVCRALERGRLVVENKRYRDELEEKNIQIGRSLAQLKEDQKAGKSVQQQLLPKSEISFGNYHFSHKVLPSLYLSGDYVDYFEINDSMLGFYIIDVSGHGASSAFVTVMIKSLIEQILLKYQMGNDDSILHPGKVLKWISDNILQAKLGKYLTMIFCLINKKDNTLKYSIGGHYPNPILVEKDKATYIEGKGFAVGIFNQAEFTTQEWPLPKEFTLCLLSDGIFEVIEGENSDAKEQALLNLVKESQGNIQTILELTGTNRDFGFPDDIAILLVRKTEKE